MWNSLVVKDLLTPVCYTAVYLVQKTSLKPLEVCTTESSGIDWVLYFLGKAEIPCVYENQVLLHLFGP